MYGIYDDDNVLLAQFTAPLTVRSNRPMFGSDTLSLKRTIVKRAAQRWEIEAGLTPLVQGAQDLFALFVTKGYDQTLKIGMPQNVGAVAALTASNTVRTTAVSQAAGISIVNTQGISGVIPKGTFIRFVDDVNPSLSHSKVYMLTKDAGTGGTGSQLHIYPELRKSVLSQIVHYGKDLTPANTVFLAAQMDFDNVSGMVYTDGILMDLGQLRFVEAL